MRAPTLAIVLISWAGLSAGEVRPAVAAAEEKTAPEIEAATRVDRILAIVDEDPILDSDVERAIGLGLAAAGAAQQTTEADRRQVLDRLIDERLRFHEIDRFGFTEIPLAEVDRGYEAIRQRFADEEAFVVRLADLGLDAEGLRQLVARQIMVLTYVEERLGSRVFVDLDDIRSYYTETLEPEMKARGESVPSLAEVREQIRAVLREQRLNDEIDRWTDELRREADIDDFFDSPLDELPAHLIDTIGSDEDPLP